MMHWACELVVDRTVLVYAPPLHERVGRWLGPVQLFAEQDALWRAAGAAVERTVEASEEAHAHSRLSASGAYVRACPARAGSVDFPGDSFAGRRRRRMSPYTSHNGHASLRWP